MAMRTELHVQAAVWTVHERRWAVLFLEGEAPDRAHGGMRADALAAAVRGRGLRLVTDPDYLSVRPIPGWRIRLHEGDTITLEWPHFSPLLSAASVPLPDGWRDAAEDLGAVVLFAGRGLGLHDHAGDGLAHPTQHLRAAAEQGDVVGGTVPLAGSDSAADLLDGTITTPRRARRCAVLSPARLADAAGPVSRGFDTALDRTYRKQ